MAYMSQEQKSKFAPKISALCKEYGVTGTLSVRHHSTIVLTISKGKIDFEGDHIQVNHYYIDSHFKGIAAEFLKKASAILHGEGYYDHSDAMTDYFNTSWYVSINIGRWDKPYILL